MKTTIPYLDDPNVIETLNYDAIYEKRKVSFLAVVYGIAFLKVATNGTD